MNDNKQKISKEGKMEVVSLILLVCATVTFYGSTTIPNPAYNNGYLAVCVLAFIEILASIWLFYTADKLRGNRCFHAQPETEALSQ